MCKIVMEEANRNLDFIIYNHLFSKEKYKFTISQLLAELQDCYNLEVPQEKIQNEINGFIESGIINQNFRSYSICGR